MIYRLLSIYSMCEQKCLCLCLSLLSYNALQSHIYAVGGNDGQKTLSSVEQYDPLLDKWTFVREMKKNRAGAGVTVLNGCLYAIGKGLEC